MSENIVNELIGCLQKETAGLKELIGLLEQETEILSSRQYEQLEALSEQKEKLSTLLENYTSERLQVLDSQDNPEQSAAQLQNILANADDEKRRKIQQYNDELQTLLQQCRDRNVTNGQVISANMNIRQELLDQLAGKNTSQASARYTATGSIEKVSDNDRHQEV